MCGSIAAYKTAMLVRLLVKSGADVQVVMTDAATQFVGPLTFSTLAKRPVIRAFVKDQHQGTWENHVEWGLWADLFVIAPASAHTISKLAQGACDNLLTAIYLSARCPVMIAPAMDLDMYRHPSTKQNLHTLVDHGVHVIDSEYGELASGLIGEGRMSEPEQILSKMEAFFSPKDGSILNANVLITAGPTYEAIDPVRYIGNHSSGKMGFAIAKACIELGAKVTLVAGPTSLQPPDGLAAYHRITTAQELLEVCLEQFPKNNIAILAAAVADYRPATVATEKIKKKDQILPLELVKTPDIALELGKIKSEGQFTVGFALETEQEEANAMKKLKSKNFDLIVLNSLKNEGAGFGFDTNKVSIFDERQLVKQTELKLKDEIAAIIMQCVSEKLACESV